MTERRFDGRVAVITGAARGLGREYARLLGSKGAKIVVNDSGGSLQGEGADASPAEQVAREIRALGSDAIACTESVATPEGGRAIIEAALDHYGRIDILIHNAGNVRYGSLDQISYEDFKAVIDVHFMGAFHVVRPAFPVMGKAGYGRIVLTSSIGGLYGTRNVVNYGMSKAGMIGLNNVVAIEGAAQGVRCNIIAPGAVTRMAEGLDISQYPPMGPELVAPVVGWLAHESCSITGEILISMAGRVARALIAEVEDRKFEYIKMMRDLGHGKRYWNDVNVGDKLPTRVIGVHSIASFTTEWRAYIFTTWGGMRRRTDINLEELGFTAEMAGKESDGEWEKINPEQTDGAYIGPSRGHLFPRWARYIGMPRGYGYGASMGSWILDYLAGWAGEWGLVVHSNCAYRGPSHTGDITIFNANVIDKRVDDQGRPVVQVDFKMTNQLGTTMATAKAEIQLPER